MTTAKSSGLDSTVNRDRVLLQLAMVRHKHTPQNSLYVGDRPEDEQAAQRAGVRFQWAWDWIEQHQEAIVP
jgi:D-glycero-D-manno-heptose 1,7-bisphosphate phosphatase